jgi:hypothetical protein
MPKVGARATPTLVLSTQKLLLSGQEILLETLFRKLKLFTETLCLVIYEYVSALQGFIFLLSRGFIRVYS